MFPYSAVPQQLKDTPNWVVWKYETRDGEPTKPPFDAKRNGDKCYAKTNDSTTWASFEQAVAATDVLNGSDYEGPGLVLKGDLQGGDLDGAVETLNNTHVISPFATSIAKLAGTYCEYSPSRTGLHLIWESPIPLPEGRKQGNHNLGGEIYDKNSSRYFTVTGDEVPGLSTGSIRRITDPNTIKLLHFLILSNKIASEKFMRLWTGAWQKTVDAHGQRFPSQSEADLALCGYLVRAGFNTTETVDAAFQHSGMMREEWEHKKKYTIAKALQGKEANTSSHTRNCPRVAEAIAIWRGKSITLLLEEVQRGMRNVTPGSQAEQRWAAQKERLLLGVKTPPEPEDENPNPRPQAARSTDGRPVQFAGQPVSPKPPVAPVTVPVFAVGEIVLQDGARYRVTEIDDAGQIIAAVPAEYPIENPVD